jgi:spore coat protein U-like protein
VNRNKIWVILESYNVDKPLINITKSLCIKPMIQIKLTNQSQPFVVNMGLRQGCGFSPVLYNIYTNKIIQLWQQTTPKGIKISNGTALQYVLYADGLVLTATLEDDV